MSLKILLLAIILVGFAFAAFAVRMFFIKGGEFKKSCSTIDPKTGQSLGCSCGSGENSVCHNKATSDKA